MRTTPTTDTDTPTDPGPTHAGRSTRRRLATPRRAVAFAAWSVVIAGACLLLAPTLLGFDRYVIVGGSMEPTFDRGSVVFAREVPVDELAEGDVITYMPPAGSGVSQLVTHRIVEIGRAEDGSAVFRTKGDANEGADPWTFQLTDDHQNVVEHSVPLLGHVLIGLADPATRMVVIGLPAALVAVGALAELVGFSFRRRLSPSAT
jgi:signal peptidase I